MDRTLHQKHHISIYDIYIYQNLTQLATLRCEKMQLWLVEMLVVLEVEEVVVASSSAKKCRAYGLLVVVVVVGTPTTWQCSNSLDVWVTCWCQELA